MTKKEKNLVRVQQIRSSIGRPSDQRKTLIGLGLNKLNRVRDLINTPANMGMIQKVRHLIQIQKS